MDAKPFLITEHSGHRYTFPLARRGERIDVLTYALTARGWELLRQRLPDARVRVLATHAHANAARELKDHAPDDVTLRSITVPSHAKAVIYPQRGYSVVGSFNITHRALQTNIETFVVVRGDSHQSIRDRFEYLWEEKSSDEIRPSRSLPDLVEDYLDVAESRLEPHPFQTRLIEQVAAFLGGRRARATSAILNVPTGAGKTLIVAEALKRLLTRKPETRALWVCHSVEALAQAYRRVRAQLQEDVARAAFHVRPEVIDRDGRSFTWSRDRLKDRQLVFETQGSLDALLEHAGSFDVVIADECHRYHGGSKRYRNLEQRVAGRWHARRLGLTATVPPEGRRPEFDRYWDRRAILGEEVTTKDLVRQKFLSSTNWTHKGQSLTRPWETGFRLRLPGHDEKHLLQRIGELNNPKVNGAVRKAFLSYCRLPCKRILCFAVDIGHAEALRRVIDDEDRIRCVHSRIGTEQEIRDSLTWFRESSTDTRMLISVLMLTEGVDLPKVDCLFMVRPTFSPILHNQMLGRGLRGPKMNGTEKCAVVDFTYYFVDGNNTVIEKQIVEGRSRPGDSEDGGEEEEEEEEELTIAETAAPGAARRPPRSPERLRVIGRGDLSNLEGSELQATHHGKTIRAKVKNGLLRITGEPGLGFKSLSGAARHVTGSQTNGNRFWTANGPVIVNVEF